jgi:transcriptional regulator with XRE-family HTH domain
VSTFGGDSPTRRQLGEALRALRRQAGLSGERLAEQLGISQSKVSRAELGEVVPSAAEVAAWARACGAADPAAAELAALAEQVGTEAVAWRRRLGRQRGLAAMQAELAALEASATVVRVYHPVLVPGLMQTPDYARAVYAARWGAERSDLGEAVTARMNRQAVLHAPGRRFEFVTTEVALRWRPSAVEVQLAQIDRVGQVASMASVQLGILPLEVEAAVWHAHQFTLFEREPDPVVHVELLSTGINIRDAEDVATYRAKFEQLAKAAVAGDAARALLARVAEDLRASS